MAGALNKRQQARNERALQELIKTVPGNDKCADCGARNPGWASWSLGIFLCVRCASLHRKIGTHVSKVKSLSMDSWSNEQVDNMKRVGNVASNRIYNPRNVKASMPIDADEVNGAMERYIRQKYELKAFTADGPPAPRHNTGATSTSTSSDDHPPALPPKPRKSFFGLRSTSSVLPSRHERTSPPVSPGLGGFGVDSSPPRVNKPSRIFGSTIGSSSSESFDAKLAQLREMGFTDERRNSTVLKGLNGNIDKTVEALIRLGGDGSRSPARTQSPAVPPKDDQYKAGISLQKTRQSATNTPLTQTPQAIISTNPFDALDAPQAQQQPPQHANSFPVPVEPNFPHPSRSFTTPNPYNPFMPQPPQPQMPQQQSLDQSFQALNIAAPPQPQQLFPNATGGYGNPPQPQSNPFLQTYTPPPASNLQTMPFSSLNTQMQPNGLSQQPQAQNPFLRQTRSQNFTSSDPNPFGLSPTQLQQSNPFGSSSQVPPQLLQQQQHPYTFPLDQQPFSQPQNQQPQAQPPQQSQPQFTSFAQQQAQQQAISGQPQQQFQPQQTQQQSFQLLQPQQQSFQPQLPQQLPMSFRHDKSSILALYNMPQLVPQLPAPSTTSDPNSPADGANNAQFQTIPFQTPKRSATMPISSPSTAPGPAAGSHNPFASSMLAPVAENGELAASAFPSAASASAFGVPSAASAGNPAGLSTAFGSAPVAGLGAGSRESVDFMGLSMSGRHSPDAFAGLSARPYVR